MTKWSVEEAKNIFDLPFNDIMHKAQTIHRKSFNPDHLQVSTLLNIKTGGCPENCSYCPQSAHYKTNLEKTRLMEIDEVVKAALHAKEVGATRFCLGAAWRSPNKKDLDIVCEMITEIKKIGLETCVTLGMLNDNQAEQLKEVGLDFYNHNIDTSDDFYEKIITTRTFQDRINTIENVRKAGIKVCCGGIIGMGETNQDRIKMLVILANLDIQPESVPINKLIKIPGTPLANQENVDSFDFIKTIALCRIMLPNSFIRLSAGRQNMSDEMQALCFLAGANSIFYGEKLLTAENSMPDRDINLFKRLGLKFLQLNNNDSMINFFNEKK
ncbi:Biotin synthase [Lyticum sinuosum]|uniref:Biotin synthase n=2 Tax=Lyticum sinuosum TaxID=1332059 RepID=A0AAE4VMI4_9RICK|nr:Biotin synthase [Lyticum sinuosum]